MQKYIAQISVFAITMKQASSVLVKQFDVKTCESNEDCYEQGYEDGWEDAKGKLDPWEPSERA